MRKKFALRLLTGVMALTLAAANAAWADEQVGNQVIFRGGWVGMTSDRSSEAFTDTFGPAGIGGKTAPKNDGKNGSYVGGELDLVLSKDVWGMMSKTWALGEIGVEYKRLNSRTVLVPVATVAGGRATTDQVPITMLTVDIAPKIKFWEGSQLRPWIIPIGLDFHVISPPSNSTTVLDIGVQFGAGLEYHLFRAFHVGLDGRFHLASGATQTTNNFGTLGAYVGIAF
jgi:hypothetical protein